MTSAHSMPDRRSDADDLHHHPDHNHIPSPILISPTYPLSTTMEEDKSQPPTPDGTGLPANFHQIGPGIYRSSYPQPTHFPALTTFHLRTLITFVPEPLPAPLTSFLLHHHITHHHIPILANKTPTVSTPSHTILTILRLLINPANHPILIHCNKGKHRTGCIAACFRKVTGWTTDACLAEYERYAAPKDRDLDKAFIRRFDAGEGGVKAAALECGFVGGAWAQQQHGFVESRAGTSRWSESTVGTGASMSEEDVGTVA